MLIGIRLKNQKKKKKIQNHFCITTNRIDRNKIKNKNQTI